MRVLTSLLILLVTNLSAQEVFTSHRRDREIRLTYDNDVLFISDQYYTSGANLAYSYIADSTKFISRLFGKEADNRAIVEFNYGHKIFNSKKVTENDPDLRDRPFAGWHYGNVSAFNFPSIKRVNKYMLEFGLVGPKSGIGNFQEWWHRSGKIVRPEGWEDQIQDELVVNLGYSRFQGMKLSNRVDLVSETNIIGGNGLTRLLEQVTLRLGKFNDINNSVFTNSRLSTVIPKVGSVDNSQEEIYFFYGIRGEYVNHNIFIDGSRFNDKSPLTRDSEDFLFTHTWGVMYSSYYSTIKVLFYRMSPEVVGGDIHRYVSFELGLRF